jgi:nucleotide-binding universal stress UspA family protein
VRLLAAVDIHASSDAVVQEAIRWAQKLGGTLSLAFVDEYEYSAHLIRDPAIRTVVVQQWDQIGATNQAELKRLVDLVPAPIRGAPVYLRGRAAETVCEAAQGYDALLVATHGRRGLDHFFLGSVAERIVRRAPCPVVVLRLPEQDKA